MPVEQIEYRAAEGGPILWLPAGEFLVRVLDAAGRTVQQYATKG